MYVFRICASLALFMTVAAMIVDCRPAMAEDSSELDSDARAALGSLCHSTPAAKDTTTITESSGIYAFSFDQKGQMAELELKGSNITKLSP